MVLRRHGAASHLDLAMSGDPLPQRNDFRHVERLRVRWVEVDMQRIVFNGHYLTYFDTAVGGYWRALALPYQSTMAGLGGDLYVRKATLEYEGSARYDDLLEIGIRCARIGNSSMLMQAAVFRGASRLVHGELTYVFATPETQIAASVPPELRAVLLGFEAGESMIHTQVGDWHAVGTEARELREAVFVQEQSIPAALVCDDTDAFALHVVVRNRLGQPIGTGRLSAHHPGVAKIERMAVLPEVRGAGIGQRLLNALLDAARQRGDRHALLHAQANAIGFYAKLGFTQQGPTFDEVGIAHQAMVRALS